MEREDPCALLGDDGRCSIYEARPLRGRAFHSCSVDPCRLAFEGRAGAEPVVSLPLERALDAVEDGYGRALEERIDAGRAIGDRVAARAGLALLIADPDRGRRGV